MEITLKIDQRKKEAKALIAYLKELSFVTIDGPRYNKETERAIKDVKTGKVFKTKNPNDLFKQLGI